MYVLWTIHISITQYIANTYDEYIFFAVEYVFHQQKLHRNYQNTLGKFRNNGVKLLPYVNLQFVIWILSCSISCISSTSCYHAFIWLIQNFGISDNFSSIGSRMSYKEGALKMIPPVPNKQAAVNNHRNSLSKTIAMNFQSSIT